MSLASDRITAAADFVGYPSVAPMVERVTVLEGLARHTIVLVDVAIERASVFERMREETPLSLLWGKPPLDLRTFYGYLNHTETVDEDNGQPFKRLVCLGSSLRLNQTHAEAWYDITPTAVVKTVAHRRGFRTVLHRSNRTLPYWSQGTETDFQMLKRLANECGYRFWVDGSTIYFLDPSRLLSSSLSADIPTLSREDDLRSFHAIDGSLAPRQDPVAVRDILGIDPRTKRVVEYSSAKSMRDHSLTVPNKRIYQPGAVSSLAEAQASAEASALLSSTWVTATANVYDRPTLSPGRVVNFEGGIPAEHQGLWLVDRTEHVLEVASAQPTIESRIEVSRNQSDHLAYQFKEHLKGAPAEVEAVLRDGVHWESSRLEAVYVD